MYTWQRAGYVASMCLVFAMLGIFCGLVYFLTSNAVMDLLGRDVAPMYTYIIKHSEYNPYWPTP